MEETNIEQNEVMRKDSEWSTIDGEPCRVIHFTPMASVQNGKIVASNITDPYASVTLECKKLPNTIKGFITHKMDFIHLWTAFKERGIFNNEEVIIIWSKRHYKYKFLKLFSAAYPKLWVMICSKGALEIMVDSKHKPELTGENRWKATKPITEWKPEVME